jgi:hypothetical protein
MGVKRQWCYFIIGTNILLVSVGVLWAPRQQRLTYPSINSFLTRKTLLIYKKAGILVEVINIKGSSCG